MKVDQEGIRIDPTPVAADGSKLEPEERGAVEVFTTPVEINVNDRVTRPGEIPAAGQMRGFVGNDSTAGEVAQDVATRCEFCRYWWKDHWQRHLASIADTVKGQKEIDALRGELLGRQDTMSVTPGDLIAVNKAIRDDFGICEAFTESKGMPILSPFYGGCPADDSHFKTRDVSAERQASSRYDTIMRLAQGRK